MCVGTVIPVHSLVLLFPFLPLYLSIFCKLAALVRHRVSLFGKEPAWWNDKISLFSTEPPLYLSLSRIPSTHLTPHVYTRGRGGRVACQHFRGRAPLPLRPSINWALNLLSLLLILRSCAFACRCCLLFCLYLYFLFPQLFWSLFGWLCL